jgi:hypothetical protein
VSDIPIIFAAELARLPQTAVFLSAVSAAQMQRYARAGWSVVAADGFSAAAEVDLDAVPAARRQDSEIAQVTVLSCEAPRLRADTARRIAAWTPAVVKINCAFHGVADAHALAVSLAEAGYAVIAAGWKDDNSFAYRAVTTFAPLAGIDAPDWDRIDVIGVRDPAVCRSMLAVGRLYAEEERRILELTVANALRGDAIARLEDALVARQPSALFRLRPS